MGKRFSSQFWVYAIGVGLVILTTLVGEGIKLIAAVDPTNMDMLYILSVVISAIYLGFGPTLMVSFLSVNAFDFFFIPPLYIFSVANQQDAINLLILLVICVVISLLSTRIMPI